MKQVFTILISALISALTVNANTFDKHFADKTLRLDYIFNGDAKHQSISFCEASSLEHWAGRRCNMDSLLYLGNGQVEMRDAESKALLYTTSFSTLFQEWLTTEECQRITKGFEHTVLLPFPLKAVDITINLCDNRHNVTATFTHCIDPNDILIRQHKRNDEVITYYTHQSGSYKDCIDIAILSEGYTKDQAGSFIMNAKTATKALFNHEPFSKLKDRFNIVAVFIPSEDEGVSVPKDNDWKDTPFSSHFSTFYSDRYLTTLNIKDVHNALTSVDYEHIIILANTEEYGGGGIFNSYTLTAARHKTFEPVVVHEFGHSFGGLADEYYYTTEADTATYPASVEPWEPNITTKVAFNTKWEKKVGKDGIGILEGAGYSGKLVYRACNDCRMKTNEWPEFCPICQEALENIIRYYTEEKNKD